MRRLCLLVCMAFLGRAEEIVFYTETPWYIPDWVQQNQSRVNDLALMAKITSQPHGFWFGNWNKDIRADVNDLLTRAEAFAASLNAESSPEKVKKVFVGLVLYNRYQ